MRPGCEWWVAFAHNLIMIRQFTEQVVEPCMMQLNYVSFNLMPSYGAHTFRSAQLQRKTCVLGLHDMLFLAMLYLT